MVVDAETKQNGESRIQRKEAKTGDSLGQPRMYR